METTKKFGILFLLEAITYRGYQFKEQLIDYPDEVFDNNEDADNWLSSRMHHYLIEHELSAIKDWTVKKIGFDLKIEVPQPVVPVIKKVRKTRKSKPLIEGKIKSNTKETISHLEAVPPPPAKPTIDFVNMAFEGRPSYKNLYGNDNPLKFVNRKEITSQLKKAINKRKILIIENDRGLGDGIGLFYKWTLEEKVDTFCVFNANELPIEYLIAKVVEYDVIAFQSQFVYENSRLLKELVVTTLTTPKTFIGVNLRGEIKYNPSKIHTLYDLEIYDGYSTHYGWSLEKLD